MITRRSLNGTAPQYLAAHCVPVSVTASRQHLRSAVSHQLHVCAVISPQFLRTSGLLCCRSDDVELSTETVAWSCPHHLRVCMLTEDISFLWVQRIRGCFFGVDALYKFTFYLLTYFLRNRRASDCPVVPAQSPWSCDVRDGVHVRAVNNTAYDKHTSYDVQGLLMGIHPVMQLMVASQLCRPAMAY